MRESTVEKAVCRHAEACDWMVLKLGGAGDRGKPDRLFLKDGRALFIEFKAPGKRPTALQAQYLERLQAAGFSAVVVDDVGVGKAMFGKGGQK